MTITTLSQQQNSKLTKADHNLFKGTAAEVHSWMSDQEILASIGCDFNVIRTPAQGPDGRAYNDCQLWLRDDNHDMLGFFGTKRQIIQPSLFIDYFRAFCDASDKAISLDVVGSYNKGRSLYMAAKLSGDNGALIAAGGGLTISQRKHSAYINSEDRTDHWLILSESFGEALRPRVSVIANELICTNGMARKVTECEVKLSHTQAMNKDIVHAVLDHAVRQCQAYDRMKERLIETPISMDTAVAALHQFFGNEQGTSRLAQRLEQIYRHELIGNDLDTRSDNAWRLASAVTQYTSHERISNSESVFRSQLEGSRARTANGFLDFLESQFTDQRDLVLA
jgi:hypothetical protein